MFFKYYIYISHLLIQFKYIDIFIILMNDNITIYLQRFVKRTLFLAFVSFVHSQMIYYVYSVYEVIHFASGRGFSCASWEHLKSISARSPPAHTCIPYNIHIHIHTLNYYTMWENILPFFMKSRLSILSKLPCQLQINYT